MPDSLPRHQKSNAPSPRLNRLRRYLQRKTRQVGLEQLEARRVMANAIMESSGLAEGENGQPQVMYYSPSVAGYVKNSNHSKLFVDDSDIVKLTVFSNQNWRHELYFDGSDVGLSSAAENVDAFAIRSDGSLLFSTVGTAYLSGVTAAGEDLMLFQPTQLGSHTSGTWQMFFDGSDVGLSNWEGLDGVSELPDGRLIIST
ncbi:MAG: hypothetical protein IT423_21945, partial [Pirellulaceae bacterium]|nr:hypothetical protein [Pirellulaceae bacterium]